MTMRMAGSLLVVALSGAGVSSAQPSPPSPSPNYADAQSWLCRPGAADACRTDLTASVVGSDGKVDRETWTSDSKAPIDCFYVYPTVSDDRAQHSDLTPGASELNVVRQQFARFGSKCRLFAPIYRQVTLLGVKGGARLDSGVGYEDVRLAWNHYLTNDNNGRGFVLIGHSQGAAILVQLLRSEIDGKPIQSRLVSAILAGTIPALEVPRGKDVGGTFKHIPLCRSESQAGCAIAYASYRSKPESFRLFGTAMNPAMVAGCTNPAALGGGSGELHAYLDSSGDVMVRSSASSPSPKAWVRPGAPVSTPYVRVPGLLTGTCVSNGNASYLEVKVNGNPADPRVDDIPGDFEPGWGLHLIDVHLALGNLIDILGHQTKAYLAK